MAEARRDDNGSYAFIGVSSADGVTPTRARLDPVTGHLLVAVVSASVTPTLPKIKIDDNGYRVGCAVTNDAASTVRPFLTDPANQGRLLVNFA